jgi:hypothetical protein
LYNKETRIVAYNELFIYAYSWFPKAKG